MTKSEVRAALIAELTEANGNVEWSTNMADRIERGELKLPMFHSDRAHELADALVQTN